ncbi:DUF4199 domain-containing protein [Maribacter polysiphoniae]|uniref:DUF4199 domain-containing protein n=1 Tax=Maribacter polysiphoniae TaxID=429344 RepID=A0A316DXH7_9FLAO|nr:DUF4199 domain-containing protein [Maribacter polysiphoniae]MBD1261476.1 DUF4199 domain-containing protein [Maribacter polysiphoniae]PWK22811.1 uncharacterized protein DUF4199 [Maribacter polysiphoniae]
MKKVVLKYGGYGFVLSTVLFLLGLYIGKGVAYSTQEVIGYVTIIASLVFVFFGIKHFRDKENQGKLSFGKGMIIGISISAISALGIALADLIYTTAINPDFFEEYKAVMVAEGYEGEIPEYSSGFMAFIMFVTVLTIGVIISLLSSLVLQRKK